MGSPHTRLTVTMISSSFLLLLSCVTMINSVPTGLATVSSNSNPNSCSSQLCIRDPSNRDIYPFIINNKQAKFLQTHTDNEGKAVYQYIDRYSGHSDTYYLLLSCWIVFSWLLVGGRQW